MKTATRSHHRLLSRAPLLVLVAAGLAILASACTSTVAPPTEADTLATQTLSDVTIDPTSNVLTLDEGETFTETITVTVPPNAGADAADIYILADTTGSMGPVIDAVKSGANDVVDGLIAALPGIDLNFGVGDYKDFPYDAYAFSHAVSITNDTTAVKAGINGWFASGGSDGSEGQFFALDQLAEDSDSSGGTIGWRAGAEKVVVWFGDAPAHDPVCAAISGLAYDITESSVTDKLVDEDVAVIAISTLTGYPDGLNDDPSFNAHDYVAYCSIAPGASDQATRITDATGGEYRAGVAAADIVDAITETITTAVTTINSLELVPTGDTAPYVTSITPSSYGPLASDVQHVLDFEVTFEGACRATEETLYGTIDARADGSTVAQKTVELTLPRCNEPPVADPNGPYLGAIDEAIAFDGSGSSDPDADPLSYYWDFGDGNTGTGVAPSHAYADAGIYPVCLTVNDGTVDSDEVCTSAVVYDPDGGFVTGGGWIDSPEGAYRSDPSLIGRANFGFVSKYKRGANVPTGNTEFRFQTAGLNFHSSSYDWMVVTHGGSMAQFKGEGTINGTGEYRFILWAGDDDPDTFRIRIWTEDESGTETEIYDNGFDQEIRGGSIVIHTKP